MKKVISFSIFGDGPKYTVGAIKNADLALAIYPDWECWFYVGTNVPESIIEELEKRSNSKVISMSDREPDWTGMFWRFEAASDKSVDVMISRDTDSRLSQREKDAVDGWLRSDKSFHIMRDHPAHATAILGGMWGVKHPRLADIKTLMSDYIQGNFWQVDQNFLREIIYPIVRDDAVVHDEFFEKNPFPTKRQEGTDFNGNPIHFVGSVFDEDDNQLI